MIQGLSIAVAAAALSGEPRQAAAAARLMGFAGLQFDAMATGFDFTALSATGRREFRQVMAHQNMQLVALRDQAGPKGLGPGADVDRVLTRWDKILETAAGLGSPLVCAELGPIPVKPAERSPDVVAALVELGRRADRYGVVVALRSDLASLAALKGVLQGANCPWFGVDFDPVAVLEDAWSTDEALAHLGPSIRHVRGRDALAGSDRRTRPAAMGRGSADWPMLLAGLDAAGYHGWITVDPMELTDRPAGAAAGLDCLRQV